MKLHEYLKTDCITAYLEWPIFPISAWQNAKKDSMLSKCRAADFILQTSTPALTIFTVTDVCLAFLCFS